MKAVKTASLSLMVVGFIAAMYFVSDFGWPLRQAFFATQQERTP